MNIQDIPNTYVKNQLRYNSVFHSKLFGDFPRSAAEISFFFFFRGFWDDARKPGQGTVYGFC